MKVVKLMVANTNKNKKGFLNPSYKITIPKHIIDYFGWNENTQLEVSVLFKKREITLKEHFDTETYELQEAAKQIVLEMRCK